MRRTVLTMQLVIISAFLLVAGGCDSPSPQMPVVPADSNEPDIAKCSFYCPARISVLPLTGFPSSGTGQESSKLTVYVSLLDAFNRQIKYPAKFRFELYQYVQFVSDHKGDRITIWQDFDLEDPQVNDHYWEDYLRAYRFELDVEPGKRPYVLEVTCLCGYGKRLSADFELK